MPVDARETSDVLEILQRKLRYRFRNPMLLLEAITHPSLTSEDVPSYNRLEFLGDGKQLPTSRVNVY
jgi:endoribonuclease Dicer